MLLFFQLPHPVWRARRGSQMIQGWFVEDDHNFCPIDISPRETPIYGHLFFLQKKWSPHIWPKLSFRKNGFCLFTFGFPPFTTNGAWDWGVVEHPPKAVWQSTWKIDPFFRDSLFMHFILLQQSVFITVHVAGIVVDAVQVCQMETLFAKKHWIKMPLRCMSFGSLTYGMCNWIEVFCPFK